METQQHRDRQELIRYVHLLRYGPSASRSPRRVFLPLKDIAKTVKVSIHSSASCSNRTLPSQIVARL